MADISKVNGVAIANISKVIGRTLATNDKVIGVTKPATGAMNILYDFENQNVQENGGADWSPSGDHSSWATDTAVVTGGGSWGNPAGNSNTTTDGWNLGQGGTASSGTGPNGGVHSDLNGTHDTSGKYMYVEGTGVKDDRVCVVRSPGINFSTTMNDTGNNLDLKFWLHNFASSGATHNLYIYIDDTATSTEASATALLASITDFSAFSANGSNWVQQTISLNSYRTTNSTFYIYFVADGATSFRCDIAIDNVQFLES